MHNLVPFCGTLHMCSRGFGTSVLSFVKANGKISIDSLLGSERFLHSEKLTGGAYYEI